MTRPQCEPRSSRTPRRHFLARARGARVRWGPCSASAAGAAAPRRTRRDASCARARFGARSPAAARRSRRRVLASQRRFKRFSFANNTVKSLHLTTPSLPPFSLPDRRENALAREQAAIAAEERQSKFDRSAVGKAAHKSQKQARATSVPDRGRDAERVRDWNS